MRKVEHLLINIKIELHLACLSNLFGLKAFNLETESKCEHLQFSAFLKTYLFRMHEYSSSRRDNRKVN